LLLGLPAVRGLDAFPTRGSSDLTVYNFMAEAARRKGAAIDWFALEPAVARMSGVGIARRAPHPNAALLFYDFMLSTEAQESLVADRKSRRLNASHQIISYAVLCL